MRNVSRLKSLIGKGVRVEFIDHCSNSEDLLHCEVYGVLSRVEKDRIVVTVWTVTNQTEKERDLNEENYCLATHLIKKVKVLK